jgi:RNA polymerase sigma factor (sigma-70 family)
MRAEMNINQLWAGPREAATAELVARYLPLVRSIAGKLLRTLPRSVQMDDLVSDGSIGMLDCVRRFETHRGLSFKTFAGRRIRGAMLDGLRERDWISRSGRQHGAKHQFHSIGQADWPASTATPEFESRESMERMTRGFNDTERSILELRFVQDLTQEQIGLSLGLTRSRISQVILDLLQRLREQLCTRPINPN